MVEKLRGIVMKHNSTHMKHFILLSLVYILSQGMLLVVSGRWWDDWVFYNQSWTALKEMGLEMGRPSLIIIMRFISILPESGYRIITFFMIYASMLFTYVVLKNWFRLDDSSCFWISMLYSVIPANDSRILSCVFSYTTGVFFFMAGLALLSFVLFKKEKLELKWRITSHILFIFSFILNSNLFFYGLIPLMIIFKAKSFRRAIGYLDYVLLPVLFALIKSIFLKPYGLYAGYNNVSLPNLIRAIFLLIPADGLMIANIFKNWISVNKSITICVLAGFLVVAVVMNKKFILAPINIEMANKNTLVLIAGFFSLSLGVLPYVIVRQTYRLCTIGLLGRDSTLVAFGSALIVYALVNIVINAPLRKAVYITLIICGILFFNRQYLVYQRDYYRQLGFEESIRENQDILKDFHTMLYMCDDTDELNAARFYSLNAIVEEVFHRQDKYIMLEASQLQDDRLEDYVKSDNYHMSEYDITYKELDVIAKYSMDISLADTLKMKVFEAIGSKRFDAFIKEKKDLKLYMSGTSEFDDIIHSMNSLSK